MKYYLVGTPESVETIQGNFLLGKLAGRTEERIFTQDEIEANLKNTENLRLFTSLDDAREYSRSLRVCRASHVPDPSRKKFAPVVEMEISDLNNGELNVGNEQTEEVTVKEYESMHHNFSTTSHTSRIAFFVVDGQKVNLSTLKTNWVEFPDTDYSATQFGADSADQALNGASKPCLLL